MKPGDLVRITRASIGYPKGTIGLVMEVKSNLGLDAHIKFVYVQVYGHENPERNTMRRYLDQDLEIIE
jgi:hypothetical protein